LIASALDAGAQKIIIGIGGSATNDAGVGMAQALGAEILDAEEQQIDFGGGNLDKIEKINLDKLDARLKEVEIVAACDVDNPLYGENGAAYVYAPQKGADQETVEILDQNLRHFNQKSIDELNINTDKIAGAGAAGGLGAGLVAFLNAELRAGIDIILDFIKFDEKLEDGDLGRTGELIASALARGVEKIIVGIGGSATNDAGVGMAQALGAEILDAEEQQIDHQAGRKKL